MSRSRSASLAAVFAVVFIDLLGFGIALPLLARYGEYFGAEAWLGLLVACYSAMQFVFAPIWGRLSDRIGRRPVLVFGLASSAVFYAMFGMASGMAKDATLLGLSPLAWLFISRTGAGIAGATITTAQAYIADVTGYADRAKGMALIGAAFGMGFTFGPMIGAAFVSGNEAAPPSPYPGYLAAGLSGLAFLAALAVLKEPERHATDLSATDLSATGLPTSRWSHLRGSFRLSLLWGIFVTTAAFAMYESTLTLLSAALGYSQRGNFFLFAYVGITLTLAQGVLVRRLAPRLGEERMIPMGLAFLTIGLGGLAFVGADRSGELWRLYAALTACVLGMSFVIPSLHSLLSKSASSEHQGAVLGLGQSAGALARIVGPLAGIAIFQRSIPASYGVAAGVIALALAASGPLLTKFRDRRTDPAEAVVEGRSPAGTMAE